MGEETQGWEHRCGRRGRGRFTEAGLAGCAEGTGPPSWPWQQAYLGHFSLGVQGLPSASKELSAQFLRPVGLTGGTR